jgi:hypothetical protein
MIRQTIKNLLQTAGRISDFNASRDDKTRTSLAIFKARGLGCLEKAEADAARTKIL